MHGTTLPRHFLFVGAALGGKSRRELSRRIMSPKSPTSNEDDFKV